MYYEAFLRALHHLHVEAKGVLGKPQDSKMGLSVFHLTTFEIANGTNSIVWWFFFNSYFQMGYVHLCRR